MVEVDRDTFERLVAEALDDVPAPFAAALAGVAVTVEHHAREGRLYGLYHGTTLMYPDAAGSLPPQIVVYMHPLVDDVASVEQLVEEIRITVLHELGHHLGLDERRLRELGYS